MYCAPCFLYNFDYFYHLGCSIDRCIAHTKCPPGKYTKKPGSTTVQPDCEPCAAGFFKSDTSNSSSKTDSCIVHKTRCPAGKYTSAKGSTMPQPMCQTCAAGFFKAASNSTCGLGRCLVVIVSHMITLYLLLHSKPTKLILA